MNFMILLATAGRGPPDRTFDDMPEKWIRNPI